MTRSQRLFLLAIVFAPAPAVAAQPDIVPQPGEWEYNVHTEIPGLPVQMPPTAFRHCLTQQDVDEGRALKQQGQTEDGGCRTLDYKQDGNRVSYRIECEGDPPSSGSYAFVLTSKSMKGGGAMSVGGQTISTRMEAQRVGDCR